MTDKVKIGYVCSRGNNHASFVGEIDYGACGSKAVADIYLTVEDREGLYPEYQGIVTSEEVAEELETIVNQWDTWREEKEWEDDE